MKYRESGDQNNSRKLFGWISYEDIALVRGMIHDNEIEESLVLLREIASRSDNAAPSKQPGDSGVR